MPLHLRYPYSGYIDFSTTSRDFTLPVPNSAGGRLLDFDIALYSLPDMQINSGAAYLQSGADYRLLVNAIDVTSAYIELLKRAISSRATELIESEYRAGVESYFRYVESLNVEAQRASDDHQFFAAYAADHDWAAKLSTLGDRGAGWNGNLHTFSYLYRFIRLPAISLADVLEHFSTYSDVLSGFDLARDLVSLTFSQGPSSLAEPFDRNVPVTGRLVYRVEAVYANPVEPVLNDIVGRLRRLAESMESVRLNYLEPVSSTVEVIRTDLEASASSLNSSLEQLTDSVKKIAP